MRLLLDMKKDAILPPVRISEQLKHKYENALEFYGMTHSDYLRFCITCIVAAEAEELRAVAEKLVPHKKA